MNLNNLKCLVDVAEAGSISQAARKNFMSQQALSDQIRRLEQHFQTPLLERTRPIRLTQAGQMVYDTAREMQAAMDDLMERVARLRDPGPRLVISTGLTRTPPFLPRLIARFQERMPDVAVHLVHPGFVREELTAPLPGADIIVGNMPFAPEVEGRVLFTDALCIVMSTELLKRMRGENWRREAERLSKGLSLEECREFPMDGEIKKKVFAPHSPGDFNTGTMENLDIILYRCSAGLEAAVLPGHFAGEALGRDERMLFFPVLPRQEAFRVGIGVRKGTVVSDAARVFIRLAEEYFQVGVQ